MQQNLAVLPIVKVNHATFLLFLTYRLPDKSTEYGETVQNCIAKMVRKTKLQMRTNSFTPKDPIFLIGFLATFKLACIIYSIHEGVAMLVVPHNVNESLSNAAKHNMCDTDRSPPISASVRKLDRRSRRLLRSYQKI